jgi:CHASE3 domain sensor protein
MTNLQKEFVQFVQMLLNDEEMQKWFVSLSKLSANDRVIELRNLAFKMSQSNEDEAIIKVVSSLSNDEVYDSIRAVLLAELNQ